VIIDGGIAGLCTAVYARKCGYDVELLEMHDTAGGPGDELTPRRLCLRNLSALADGLQSPPTVP
jgi:2-polyprenyl-6-methoxyphenol hydroxylase-like FAD-dependent oxidoreductase